MNENHVDDPKSRYARKPLLAALMSIAAPGLGHIYGGRLSKGLFLYLLSFALAPLVVSAARSQSGIVILWTLMGALVMVFGVMIYAVVDAYRLARRHRREYRPKEYNRWYLYLMLLVVSVTYPTGTAYAVRDHMLHPFKIVTASMQPNMAPGDRIFLNKAIYSTRRPQRGDVVIFIYPDDRRMFYVKRIVALGGDRVAIKGGRLHINGQALAYQPAQADPAKGTLPEGTVMREINHGRAYDVVLGATSKDMAEVAVPHGSCFALGDRRAESEDSRDFGPVPLVDVKGKVAFVYWPFSKLGTYTD